MVARVGAHKHKRRPPLLMRGSRARQGAQMPHGMARRIEEVEGPVAKVVKGVEPANLEAARGRVVKGYLDDLTALDVCVEDEGVGARGEAGPRGGADAGADDQRRGFGKAGHVADVVEVVVGPDDGADVGATDVGVAAGRRLVQHGGHVFTWGDDRRGGDQSDRLGGIVAPVGPCAEIEDHVLASSVVGDQETVDGGVEAGEAVDFWSPE